MIASTPTAKSLLLVIGNDKRIAYLLRRYAEQSGCRMIFQESVPANVDHLQPSVIIFSSPEILKSDRNQVETLSKKEIPILVCASIADEVEARESGADACLLHPLKYENFISVLAVFLPKADTPVYRQ
jgi:CheY-like chemotaxis protein